MGDLLPGEKNAFFSFARLAGSAPVRLNPPGLLKHHASPTSGGSAVRSIAAVASSSIAAIGAAQTPPGLSFPEFYDLAAEVVAEAVVADVQANGASSHLAGFLPCVGEASPDAVSCYADLAQDFAPILFRRPITQDDVNWITDIADQGQTWGGGSFFTGLEYALRAMLQAPSFLYLPEVGEPDADEPTFHRLTGYELASRMAFFLTDTTPDLELLDAAQSGELDTDAGVTTHATRLLASPAARLTVRRRFREFLYLGGVMTAQMTELVSKINQLKKKKAKKQKKTSAHISSQWRR